MNSEAYREGYEAAAMGWNIDDNPYDPLGTNEDFEDWGEWEEGFFLFFTGNPLT